MNSLQDNLDLIEKDLLRFSGKNREELLEIFVKKRLINTLTFYDEELANSSEYLLAKETMRVLKAYTKLAKAEDKKVILDNSSEDKANE